MEQKYRILGVAGSLRSESLNQRFLRAMALLKPAGIDYEISVLPGKLPAFNPDYDDCPPPAVAKWRSELVGADMVLLVSPEYARGVTGVIKNAFDWIVGSGELTDKLLAFPNLSVRAGVAQSQLAEMLKIIGCVQIESCSPQASLAHPLILPELDEKALTTDPRTGPALKQLWLNIGQALNDNIALKQPERDRFIW